MYDIQKGYELAKAYYKELGIDTDEVIRKVNDKAISMHCWQGDDVIGFEKNAGSLSGGIQTTGNYPGRARNAEELRADIEEVLKYIPGKTRLNLHANYLEADHAVPRNEILPEHFANWIDWAVEKGIGLDFNDTYFSHPLSEHGTLSAADESVRKFWIEHGIACRRIGGVFAEKTGGPCVINHWTPDGDKEFPIDTLSPRLRMKDSLDQIFEATKDVKGVVDGIESKLFGIGMESYTVGSHEFCTSYVMSKHCPHIIMTLDAGHYHPTEVVSNKLGAIFSFSDNVLLHVSRPVRWDSDHVVAYDDETKTIMEELVRMNRLDATYVATDFFDASVNRLVAWATGLRNVRKAMMAAMLQPIDALRKVEQEGDVSARLAMVQEYKAGGMLTLVWNYYCASQNKGEGLVWLDAIKDYEKKVLSARS